MAGAAVGISMEGLVLHLLLQGIGMRAEPDPPALPLGVGDALRADCLLAFSMSMRWYLRKALWRAWS